MEVSLGLKKGKSKYIKERETKLFYRSSVLFIFALYVLPPYFGIRLPGFDMTALRFMTLVILLLIFADHKRANDFLELIKEEKITPFLLFYIFVLGYTMVFRADFNCFFNPFIEILQLYLLIYVIRESVGVNKTVKMLIAYLYLFVVLGIVEAVTQFSPFLLLQTIHRGTLYSGSFVRNGSYRIMSNAGHSLGYGLFLVTAMPFAGIDLEANEYNIFKRPLLLIGTIINIFLTGSRSSLGIMVLEFALMFIFTEKKYIKMNIVSLVVFSSLFMAVVFATQSTSFGKYIMLQITLLIDTLFDTTFSIKYGADLTNMKGSSNYRRHIWRIFFLKWLNPILGQGKKRGFMSVLDDGSVIRSIDNFYVYHYVMYAYPGLISYCLFLISMGLRMIIEFFRSKSALVKMVLIGTIGYYIHLSVVDALMTLKYQYVLFAIFICLDLPKNEKNLTSSYFGKKKSVYIKE
ncbi:MAG: hypothetical protein E7303_05050 [Butyrivibrio sp.]|nr:hypothetical protein [Butyrivibrio sp.]